LMILEITYAAFDTIDHNILKNRLSQWVGLSGSVLNWFESYLAGRKFFVSCGNYNSKTHDILYGVPQGSILGPLLFSIYMLPLGQIISGHNVSYHSYADDTQLYLSIAPDDPKSLDSLTQCLTCISEWMNSNFLKLNKEKTEILLVVDFRRPRPLLDPMIIRGTVWMINWTGLPILILCARQERAGYTSLEDWRPSTSAIRRLWRMPSST
uniref:Reverse transcriptase domain-containing protein n=1 Tax=Erpetoichthys calabaricus TaxID=27687 RepID=A0A8C4SGV0_ERPCA